MLQRLQTSKTGTVIGALFILLGGIVTVSGAASAGTFFAIVGFGLVLRFRILAARRDRHK